MAQLQMLSDDLILKGGAAAQLYLPIEGQRGSVDIDLTTHLRRDELDQLVSKVSQKFRAATPLFQFKKYSPKAPKVNVPITTYDVLLPSVFRGDCSIKVDILTSDLSLPIVEMSGIETFAIKVSKAKIISLGALIGDKLLTLAGGTIGMMSEEDYPKQIYDVEMLAFRGGRLTEGAIKDAADAIEKIVLEEARFRRIETSPIGVLKDVEKTMECYSLVDLAVGNTSTKRNINNFQQFYVHRREMSTRLYEWSSRALRVKFLATLMQTHLSGKIDAGRVVQSILKSQDVSSRMREARREDVPKLRGQLLAHAEACTSSFKELRGKPLERIFWQILTPDNVDKMAELL
ncbi:MAG: nucleotidyl transferase AbiEii/AbiGii toxin family protein [Candidatus Verstraetearchaeota archaeon]|nr:nucleotidyl transferase AbiEii/AbiGii toxin family protein [Candidatus Verstraetearchaeota archaeon]